MKDGADLYKASMGKSSLFPLEPTEYCSPSHVYVSQGPEGDGGKGNGMGVGKGVQLFRNQNALPKDARASISVGEIPCTETVKSKFLSC